MAGTLTQQSNGVVPEGADFRVVPCATDFLNLEIDKSAMWIGPLPITDDSEDREGDRIDPNGLLVTSYMSNPAVFWNHSHQVDPMVPAIGTAENRDRSFGVYRSGNAWYAPTLFSQSLPLAHQTFHLICEGIIRTRSVGAIPFDIDTMSPSIPTVGLHEGRTVVMNPVSSFFRTAEMIEFSWTNISCNRGMTIDRKIAIKSLLSRPRINGERWDKFLFKSLKSMDLSENKSFAGYGPGLGASKMSGPIVAVLFDKSVSRGDAARFLKQSGDFIETDLVVDSSFGCLKSAQVDYAGAVVVKSVPGAPLIRLVHADVPVGPLPKGGTIMKAYGTNKTDDLRAEADAVQAAGGQKPPEQPPAQPGAAQPAPKPPGQPGSAGAAQPAQKPAPQPGAPGGQLPAAGAQVGAPENEEVKAIDMVTEALMVDQEQPLSGPAGSQHIQGLVRSLMKVLQESDASIADVEHPDVRTAHGNFRDLASKAVMELKRLHDSTYTGHEGVTVKMCDDCEAEQKMEQEKQVAENGSPEQKQEVMTKMLHRREVFRGCRQRVSGSVVKALMTPIRVSVTKSHAPEQSSADADKRARLLDEAATLGVFSGGSIFSGLSDAVGGLGPQR